MHKDEFKELLSIFRYYLLSGLAIGIASSSIAVSSGILLVRPSDGAPLSPKMVTAAIAVLIGASTGLLAFLVLLPAELKLIRKKAAAILYAQRISGKK
jgi:hypothetical protein